MKSLNQFRSFEISKDQQRLLIGGTEACEEAHGCILTSIRDNGGALIDTCIDVLCDSEEQV